jgi:peptide/nickel transport system substrate-binding protein
MEADSQDDLRPAYLDAISVRSAGCDQEVAEKKVAADEIDHIFANGVSAVTAREFSTDPELQSRYFVEPGSGNYYIALNVAVPPFDDVHVRKAVNFAVNKEGWRRLGGGETFGEIAGYFTPPGLLGGLLEVRPTPRRTARARTRPRAAAREGRDGGRSTTRMVTVLRRRSAGCALGRVVGRVAEASDADRAEPRGHRHQSST